MMTAAFAASQLDTTVRETFERDGVVCIRDLIAPEWIDALRIAFEDVMAHPKPTDRPKPPAISLRTAFGVAGRPFAPSRWMEAWLALRH